MESQLPGLHRHGSPATAPESGAAQYRAVAGQAQGGVPPGTMTHTIKDLIPIRRGWIAYFRLAQVKGTFEDFDGWLRRKMRCILWRQWKRPRTRATKLRQRGLDEVRARQSGSNGRGPWWN